jgi:hypothetical protein
MPSGSSPGASRVIERIILNLDIRSPSHGLSPIAIGSDAGISIRVIRMNYSNKIIEIDNYYKLK